MNRSVLIIALLLTACGQTGALYLPDHPPPQHGIGITQAAAGPTSDSGKTDVNTPTSINVTSSTLRDRLLQTAVPSVTTIPAQPVPAGGLGSPLPPTAP